MSVDNEGQDVMPRGEESPIAQSSPGIQSEETDFSAALFGAAVLYVVATFGAILASVGLCHMGPLSLPIPLFLVGLPLLALSIMVILRVGRIRFHWMAMIGFTIIILATTWFQLLIFHHASASV